MFKQLTMKKIISICIKIMIVLTFIFLFVYLNIRGCAPKYSISPYLM